jgi:hypothetical protein
MEPNLRRPIFRLRILTAILALVLGNMACGSTQPKAAPTQVSNTIAALPTDTQVQPTAVEPSRTPEPTTAPEPTKTLAPTNTPVEPAGLFHLWASAGEASSEYGYPEWSAQQAAGAPDTPVCGDATTAWAASAPDSVESITVFYMEQPLIPTAVNVVQSYHPSQVVKVELLDAYSQHYDVVIYEGKPKAVTECPYTLSIPVTGIDYPIMGVRVTIDQSVLGLGRNMIDAVELVGNALAGYEPLPTAPAPPEGIWDNVYALPIFPTANGVSYVGEDILIYYVGNQSRQDVLDFLLTELETYGWRLDVDENGNCLFADRCPSKAEGLDYKSADNELWYFVHLDSPEAHLALTLNEIGGEWAVGMSLK